MPLDDVLYLGRSLPKSLLTPLSRITIVELASGPPSSSDLQRLATYVSPPKGQVLVGAVRIDVESKTARASDGLSPKRTHIPRSDEPLHIVVNITGATIETIDTWTFADAVPLFTTRAAMLAAFLLSPIAGAGLFAWNLHRTRRTRLGVSAFFGLTFLLGFLLVLADYFEISVATPGLAVGGGIIVYQLMKTHFGEPLKKASGFFAFAVSVASLIVFFAAIAGPLIAIDVMGQKEMTSENGGKLFYDRHTSDADAQKVTTILQERGVLGGPQSGVNLTVEGRKTKDHRFLLHFDDEHTHEKPDIREFYQALATDLSLGVFKGEKVSFVFQSSIGVELARVTSL